MTTYECNIVVLSNCTFECTPIIYEYIPRQCSVITHIETVNFVFNHKQDIIKVELKQIETSLQMLEFIKINVDNAHLVIIYESGSTNCIPNSILCLVENKSVLTLNNKFDSKNTIKNTIKNKILILMQQNNLSHNLISTTPIDNTVNTIFGKTKNQRLIAIDNWLDRWLFCCIG